MRSEKNRDMKMRGSQMNQMNEKTGRGGDISERRKLDQETTKLVEWDVCFVVSDVCAEK